MFSIENGLVTPARWCPSPNYGPRPHAEVSLLVLHNISLPPSEFGGGYVEQFFTNQLDPNAHPYFAEIAELKVSSHVFIQRDGQLIQFVNLNDRAWHAGQSEYQGRSDCNDFSIGIELEGADNIAYSEAQYHSLTQLAQAILKHYPAINPYRITGHEQIAPQRKTDPGNSFQWQHFFTELKRTHQTER